MNKGKIIDNLDKASKILNFNLFNLHSCCNILKSLLLGDGSSLPNNEKDASNELLNLMYEDLDELDNIALILKSLDKTEVNKIGN